MTSTQQQKAPKPSDTPTQNQVDWGLIRKLFPFMRPDALFYVLALICAPVSALLVIAQPYILRLAIDDYIKTSDVAGLQTIAWLYCGAVVFGFIAEAGYTLSISYGAMRTIARLRNAVYTHTTGLARSFFDREPTGKLLTRATSDVDALGETLTAGAITILLDALLVLGVLTAMLVMNYKLTLIVVFISPFLAITINVIRRILRKLFQTVRTSLAELNAFLAERLAGVRTVQLYSDEERSLEKFDERLYRYRDATIKTNVWDAFLYALVDGLSSICVAAMLWYTGIADAETAITAGMLAAFIDYVAKLFRPISDFSAKIAIIQRAVAALEKIFGLLDHSESIESGPQTLQDPSNPGPVHFDSVSFRYSEDGPEILKSVSLSLNPGDVVAVVGRTGSGKTTLGKLLSRMYQGYTGTISIGPHDLRDLSLDTIRKTVGVVHQDVQLFPGDVRINLTLGQDISDERLWDAIRLVHAERTVEKLGGLDGKITHEGANLSAGERQILAFARTIAHDTPVVILDEATASVDSLTEAAIQTATEAILARKTVLVIAHRLSTIMHADNILVLDAGTVLESGTHDELIAQGGSYADLFSKQFTEHDTQDEAP